MSLQIWLPLNGNLENQGLTDIEATNAGATTNANGKIGSCYYFNGTSSRVGFPEIAISYPISICAWIKGETITASGTEYILSYNTPTGGTSGHAIGFGTYTGKLSIWHGGTVHSYGTALTNNVWYHVAAVVTESSYGLYLDGNLVLSGSGTQTVVNSKCITIGARSNNSGGGAAGAAYFFKGFMNDVRIYDHALSAKEVRELAKGLVLHYKLDDGYVEGTTNLCSGLVAGGRTVVENNTVTNTGENADTYWFIKPKEATIGGSTYTLSCDLSGFNSGSSYIQWGVVSQSSGLNWKTYNGHNEFTFTMPASRDGSTKNIIFDDNGGTRTQVFTISNVQFEKKDHATPYVGGPGLTRIPTTVYDSSGFGYNGTITGGSLTTASDSARYSASTAFPGTVYIDSASPTAEVKTIAFWAKWNAISSSNSIIYVDYKSKTGFGLASNGLICSSANLSTKTFNKSSLVANTWYHFVIVCPNGASDVARKLYINGVEQTATSNSNVWTSPGDKLNVGKRSTTSNDGFNGKLSDFRMYSTALSADDILELYHTSASIDKSGSIYARELVE